MRCHCFGTGHWGAEPAVLQRLRRNLFRCSVPCYFEYIGTIDMLVLVTWKSRPCFDVNVQWLVIPPS